MTTEDIIFNKVMYGEPSSLRALFRQSSGSMKKAYSIVRAVASHYTKQQIEDIDITNALARLDGGCEVEWESE